MDLRESNKKPGRGRAILLVSLLVLSSLGLFLGINHPTDRLIFGTWCKDCEKNCTLLYEISPDGLSIDQPSNFHSEFVRMGTFQFVGDTPNQRLLDQYFDLNLRSVPGWLFFWPGFTDAQPSPKTNCTMYLRIENWGIKRDFWINPDDPPGLLKELVEGLLFADRQLCGQTVENCVYQERAFVKE